MSDLFTFPNPVNEVSARLVAGGVVIMSVITIAFDQPWLLLVIAYGFLARVLTGPTLSPLGQLVTRVITPALHVPPKNVAGPPKRFAQGIGATLSTAAVDRLLRVRREDHGVRPGGVHHHCGHAGIGVRVLPRLQGLRGAHALRRHPRGSLRALQQPDAST